MNPILQAAITAAAAGTFLPPLIAIVMRQHWPSPVKAAIAVLTSALAGTASAFSTGEFTGLSLVAAIPVAFIATQAAYVKFWHSTGIAPWLETHVLPGETR